MKTKKIVVFFTGGTISMKVDPKINAAIPALKSEEILAMTTNIDKYADLEIINFSNLPGPQMTPNIMFRLSKEIQAKLDDSQVDGIIVTHGTDSLEETAYFLDLTLNSPKPVIVVGAMRNSSELGYDGPSNLSAAVCTAISKEAENKGVLVVMNNEVNAASEVTKTNTLSLNTFRSPEFGPIGIVDNDEVLFYRETPKTPHYEIHHLIDKVGLIKAYTGMGSDLIDFFIEQKYQGLVIEAMGRGNLPPEMLPGIKRCIQHHMPVVIVSRCHTGRVLDSYGYDGGGWQLKQFGAILGTDIPGQKARIKLIVALSFTDDMEKIKTIMKLK